VVWDNLSVHKSVAALAAIEARGAEVLALPPYSPDLNPIEKMWSKVKSLLRAAGARTRETLHEALGSAMDALDRAVGPRMVCPLRLRGPVRWKCSVASSVNRKPL
jgi:transposase